MSGQNQDQMSMREKLKRYQDIRKRYIEGGISEEEFEKKATELTDSKQEFFEYEHTARDRARGIGALAKKKLLYYSIPICVLAPIVAILLIPGLGPMLAILSGIKLAILGAVAWIILKLYGFI